MSTPSERVSISPAHLEDAFLVRLAPLATRSERQRQSNLRKVYPIDAGLIGAFDRSGKSNKIWLGHALETAVLIELERRSARLCANAGRFRGGFSPPRPSPASPRSSRSLADLADPATRARELLRPPSCAPAASPRRARYYSPWLPAAPPPPEAEAPKGVRVQAAWEWLLMNEE
ncbi:MAG: hypothetical protein ACREEM_05145 [Blastocatellia bacterium]